jgi:purine-binding chemotaxis protein CheW
MTEKTPARAAATNVDLACFELAGQTYAVPIANVREILATPRLTPLPDAPSVIEGVIELRGALIPVVDLESLLVREGTPTGPRSRTVVVETRDLVIGFRVDRATQVVATTADAMERLPELAREVGCLVVGAVVRRKDRPPILVLDLDVLLDRVVRSGSSACASGEVAA